MDKTEAHVIKQALIEYQKHFNKHTFTFHLCKDLIEKYKKLERS